MSHTYAVLGAGRQGTAAAYDMARWGEARRILLADQDLEVAQRAANRVNHLIGHDIADAKELDVTDADALTLFLADVDSGLTNEYAEPAIFLRNGKVTEVEPISELETVEFPEPIGTLEAFVAGGGTDTIERGHGYRDDGPWRDSRGRRWGRYPGAGAPLCERGSPARAQLD